MSFKQKLTFLKLVVMKRAQIFYKTFVITNHKTILHLWMDCKTNRTTYLTSNLTFSSSSSSWVRSTWMTGAMLESAAHRWRAQCQVGDGEDAENTMDRRDNCANRGRSLSRQHKRSVVLKWKGTVTSSMLWKFGGRGNGKWYRADGLQGDTKV